MVTGENINRDNSNSYQTFENEDDEICTDEDGDSRFGINKRALYEPSGMVDRVRRVILSPRKAGFIAIGCFACILCIALIAAFARPYVSCPCGTQDNGQAGSGTHLTATNGGASSRPLPTPPTATNGEPFPWGAIRLQPEIFPSRYSIYLRPNLTTFDYSGTVNITFRLLKPLNFIILHAKQLNLSDVHLINSSSAAPKVVKTLEYVAHEQLYVQFNQKLDEDVDYTLSLGFAANLTEKLEGFYLSSYTTLDGQKRYLATTHFEPTYARMAFPCFDEPALKATFQISIVREPPYESLFNTPIMHTEVLSNGLVVDHFMETVRMSTYLVAFVVCDYKNITAMTEHDVKVSVFAPADQINQAEFALQIATKVMDYYNDYFGIPYPLPKQDLIGIPDFASGAMENWGLTTYREIAILADFNETSIVKQQQVTVAITHELAHQWFGNLVTMKWWNDLWLNEGFASFVEYIGTEHVKPEWKMMDQFILEKTQPALVLDALASSHPISVPVVDPADIEAIFDAISYNKGAAIIYMLESFLGQETLQRGLATYLNTFKFSNAQTEDLWQVLSQESRRLKVAVDVKAIMGTWTQQMGFPLITIKRKGNTVYATQQRFLVGSGAEDDGVSSEFISAYGYKWYVPLTYITNKSPSSSNLTWMNMEDTTFEVDSDVEWIKCNVNQTGFYRVTYEDAMWRKLVNALQENHTMFSAADRASLLDDAFTLAKNSMLDPTIPLEMSKYLVKERDYIPWITAIENLGSLENVLGERPAYIYLKKFVHRLLIPIIDYLGWTDTGTQSERLLRPNILLEAVRCDNKTVIQEAKKMFDAWRDNNTRVPPSLRGVVYTVGISEGNYTDWMHCFNHYNQTHLPSEKSILQNALGATKDAWIMSQYLDYSLQKDKVRPQNTHSVLRALNYNSHGRDLTWRFVRSHWKKLIELFGLGSFTMSHIILDVTSRFSTQFDYQEVKAFFENRDVGSGKRAVKSSLEKIHSNIEWLEKNDKAVEEWLRAQVGPEL